MNFIVFLFLAFLSFNSDAAVSGEELLRKVNNSIQNINTAQLQKQLKNKPNTVLIDVRTQFEVRQLGTIGVYQNRNIPRGWIEFRIEEEVLSLDTPIVVYCGTNVRSPMAAKTLMDMGYTNVKNYSDTYFDWQKQGLNVSISSIDIDSLLYRKPKKVIDRVYTAIGATQPSTYENSGHNNNLSFIIADDAVVVFNGGGSYLLAQAMHAEIKKITSLPVKYVVYENAQGHAILGGSYWKEQDAIIVGHELTPEIIEHSKDEIVERAKNNLKDKYFNSHIVMPDVTFKRSLKLDVKGINVVLNHFGHAHSPDDIQLLLPDENFMIGGDFTFNERMLPILDHTDIYKWLENWEKLETLNPEIIIPGHGDVTDLATVRYFTKDYLAFMLEQVSAIVDEGGINDAYKIDQSAYSDWATFRELAQRNSAQVFRWLEFY